MSHKPKSLVYIIKHKTLQSPSVCWADIESALEEIRMHLSESADGDEIEIKIKKMTYEEFEKLPEFQGY